jgi:hypothetical protein
MAQDNCGIPEYCPSLAEKCLQLIPSYEIVQQDNNAIWVRWTGQGTPDILEWHLGKWGTGALPTGNGIPIGEFQTIAVAGGDFNIEENRFVAFTCVPADDLTIVLVAKIGNCPLLTSLPACQNMIQVGNVFTLQQPGCLLCGYVPNGNLSNTTVSNGQCCIKMFDICNDLNTAFPVLNVAYCTCVSQNNPANPYTVKINTVPQVANFITNNYIVPAGATVEITLNLVIPCTFTGATRGDNPTNTPSEEIFISNPITFTMPTHREYVILNCQPPPPPPPVTTYDVVVTNNCFPISTMSFIGVLNIIGAGNIAVVTVITGNTWTVQVCDGTACECPTMLTDNFGTNYFPNRVDTPALGCAQWDFNDSSINTLTIQPCAQCAIPYNCTPLAPQPPNSNLVEIVNQPLPPATPNLTCMSISSGSVFRAECTTGCIDFSRFQNIPTDRIWMTTGNTLRVTIKKRNILDPNPTFDGGAIVFSGYYLANQQLPQYDFPITSNTLIVLDPLMYPAGYFTLYPYTKHLVDPC